MLFVESVPLGSEDEPDGLCSLSVEEEGPDDGGDLSRREGLCRCCSERAPSLGGRPAAACSDLDLVDRPVRVGTTVRAGATAARPSPRADPRVCPSRAPGQPVFPRPPTSGKAPGPPQALKRRPHCAAGTGFHPKPR